MKNILSTQLLVLLILSLISCKKESSEPKLASITTGEVYSFGSYVAFTNGEVLSDAGEVITAKGVVWSMSTNPTILLSTKTSDGEGIGGFGSELTGLNPNTTYYVRAYATNKAGTAYGNEVTFKTLGIGTTVAGGNDSGIAANQLKNPIGAFVDASGNVFIADYGNHRIQKWAPGATSGTTVVGSLTGIANPNTDPLSPRAVYVTTNGDIYVLDYARVLKWTANSSSPTTVAGKNTGQGSYGTELRDPRGMYIDANGNIYIADTGNHRVQKWTPGATSGITVAGTGISGTSSSELRMPNDVYVAADGAIYIADTGNDRIQKWLPGATSGTTVIQNNNADNNFRGPMGIYGDPSGNLYVTLVGPPDVVKKWTASTDKLSLVAGYQTGNTADRFRFPSDIFPDANGNWYIVDTMNNRIQKWRF